MSSGPGIASKDRENVVANTTSTTKNRDKDSISSAAAPAKDSKTSNFTSVNNKSRDSGKSTQDASLLKQGSGGSCSQYPPSGARWSPAVGPASAFPPLGAEPPPALPSPKQSLVATNPLSLPPTEFPELG